MTTRMWIATALLAGSWLFGQTYYEPAAFLPWTASILLGTLLLWGTTGKALSRSQSTVAAGLLLISIWFFPIPVK